MDFINITEVKKFLNEKLGKEYLLLSNEYKNTRSNLKIKHLTCNNEYTVIAYNVLKDNPTKCPYCYGNKRLTINQLKEKVNPSNSEYEILGGTYINNKTSDIIFRHIKCNKEFHANFTYVKNGLKKCPYCSPYRITTEDFKEKVKNITNDEFTVLGEYINKNTKILIKHNKCNKEFEVLPPNFLKKKNKCPYCHKNNKRNTDIYKFEIKEMYNDEYTLLENYINSKTKILMKHNKCGFEWKVAPDNFLAGTKCPKCNINRQRLTTEEFKKRVFNKVGNDYTVLGEYINYNTKILIKHNKCNNEFEMSPTHFLNGERCPKCRNYKGEERIENWLKKNNIDYKTQFSFKDLYYKDKNKPLKFDFKLEYEDGSLLLIEFDGIQHFQNWYYNSLEDIKIRDNLKNEYCKKNNIELLRITYKDFNNIEKILKEYLNI